MNAALTKRLTAKEYLTVERLAESKSEFLDGVMSALPGGNSAHSSIVANVIGIIHCECKGTHAKILGGDMRLFVPATGLFTYSDAVAVSGDQFFADEQKDALLNPAVIFEVLSPSTAAWDRGQKFWHYRHLASLQEYVLVSQDHWLVERYRRQENGAWLLDSLDTAGAVLRLESVGCELPLSEIYAGVELVPQGLA